ncbi:MAG: 30S ribosomal protein S17 [Chrysiogenetes bacterium]|nr:30S ribosomal protein S17 [Chrysiogenetes bacterium]
MPQTSEDTRKAPRTQVGQVLSNKMDKTVVVGVTLLIPHPVYKKYVRRNKKYTAHDEENTCQIGDRVEIVETRPLSKTKRWRLSRVVERAKV